MMRKSLAYPAILLCLVFLAVDLSFAQSYTGTYTVANQQGGIITLTLRQDAQNAVLGTMSGNGVQFQVEGIVEEGVAVGAIYNEEGGVYFEAQLQGSQLLLSLFNVGPDNEPDYSNPTELVLSRQAGAAAPTPSQPPSAAPGAAPSEGGNPLGGGSTFAGSFVGEGISLQLQGTQGGYNGTLTFQGQSYPVQASATGGRLQGSFAAGGESYPFEAALQGESLTLVSAGNTYQLQRQSGGQGTANPLSRPGAAAGAANAAPGAAVSQPIPAAPAAAGPSAAAPGAGEVSDPAWGFAFTPPEGWKHQKGYAGAMLGHDRIAGLIIVLPHQSASLQELGAEMQKGMSEEGIYLAPAGQITQRGADVLTGEYSGNVQGEQARARGFGTLSPYGGGAYVVAVTTPEKYGSELQGA
ncbi:MAG: hypothetical protein JSU87_04780, partial [Gemmatimonadota bacterium]